MNLRNKQSIHNRKIFNTPQELWAKICTTASSPQTLAKIEIDWIFERTLLSLLREAASLLAVPIYLPIRFFFSLNFFWSSSDILSTVFTDRIGFQTLTVVCGSISCRFHLNIFYCGDDHTSRASCLHYTVSATQVIHLDLDNVNRFPSSHHH